jgi:hypothetical protein
MDKSLQLGEWEYFIIQLHAVISATQYLYLNWQNMETFKNLIHISYMVAFVTVFERSDTQPTKVRFPGNCQPTVIYVLRRKSVFTFTIASGTGSYHKIVLLFNYLPRYKT